MQKLLSFLAAVCPAIVKYPSPFIALCKITVPVDTIAIINPIERPCPNSSLYSSFPTAKCFFFGIRILLFEYIYEIHNTTEIP